MSAVGAGQGPAAPTHRRGSTAASALTGLGTVLSLFVRLARRQVIIWVLAMGLGVGMSVAAMKGVYPDQQSLDARAALLENPSAVLMTGPAFALDDYTFWAMVANELLLYVLVAVGIMSILLTVRLTRAEEEAGRMEMLRALPVGLTAPSLAAFVVVAAADLAVGAAAGLGLLATGGPVAGSLAIALATCMTGLFFAAVAGVLSQLTAQAGRASGAALGLLALAFVIRGLGDVLDPQGSWLSWFSPFAWAQQARAYVDLRWWPLALTGALILVLLALAALLSRRRDLGAGLRAAAAGPGRASSRLLGAGGLPRRLLAPMMGAWGIGLFLVAIAFGTLATSLEDMVSDIPGIGEMVPLDLEDLTASFAAYVLQMLALGPLGLLVAGILRLRTEEEQGRLVALLLDGRSRIALAGSWMLVAAVWALSVQVLLGLGVGLGVWQATGDASWLGRMALAALASWPAIAVAGGVASALYGLHPRLAPLAWVLVIWAALDTFLGELLDLPDAVRGISPLFHVVLVPAAEVDPIPLLVMSGLAVVLAAVGMLLLRRRDLGS